MQLRDHFIYFILCLMGILLFLESYKHQDV